MTPYMKKPAMFAAVFVGAIALASCGTTDILQVTDPDIINPSDVQSAAGANAVRTGAIGRLGSATSGGSSASEGLFLLSGLLADEWINGDSFIARQEVDQRVITTANTFLTDVNRMLQRARLSGLQAVQLLRQFSPLGPTADVAEMYFVQAYAENALAESWCNGMVISSVVNGVEQYGSPQTNAAVFALALAHADSGLSIITGFSVADVKVRNALSLIKGRILVNLNRHADAATAVASVPSSYSYLNYYLAVTNDQAMWSYNNTARRYSMSSGEGTNGLNYATAADPRVKSCLGGDAACVAAGTTIKTRDDGTTPVTVQLVYPARDASIPLTVGIEARMIEAEAAYKAGNFALMVTKLNQARTDASLAGLTATLADPGTSVTRENLLFRERAFWFFGRGMRLGDMRRLIRQYGRATETVFPTGAWHKAGNYGTDINFPVPQAEQNNPNVPSGTNTCIDRSA